MTHEMSTSTNRRVIIDLSWPKDYSVNAGVDKNSYLGTDFVFSFPTIDDITEAVKKVGKGGTQIFQRLSDAIRHMMRCHRFTLLNYIDDFIGVATPCVACHSYDALLELLQKLGLEESIKNESVLQQK